MSATTFTAMYRMANNLIKVAKEKGLTPVRPARFELYGSALQGELAACVRWCTVAYIQPPVPQFGSEIWVDVQNRWIFLSDPVENTWTLVHEYYELFSSRLQVGGGGSGGGSGTNGKVMISPVATLTDLREIDTGAVADKVTIYVEGENAIYAFDQESTAPVSATVIRPDVGPGRWNLVTASFNADLNLDGGVYA